MTIKEKRLRPHSPISMLSLLCNGGFNKIAKQKIRNELYILPSTDGDLYADVRGKLEPKHILTVPILLRTLFHLPNQYVRKIVSWYPFRAFGEGFSFIISPPEINRGVILEDSKIKEYFYLSGLPYNSFSIVTDNYEVFMLSRRKNGVWEGFDCLVDRFGLIGGERVGFALTDKGQVYFEVINRDPFWWNWGDFLNKIHLSKTSVEVASLLQKHGITNANYQINEIIFKGLYELGLSYDLCQQVIRDLKDLNAAVIKSNSDGKLGDTDAGGYVTRSYTEVERRGDSTFMGSTEDLLAELVKRFNIQNEENEKLREENRELIEKVDALENLKKSPGERETQGFKDAFGEVDKSQLERFSVLYQKNGALLTYLTNILAMAGEEGLEVEDLAELAYTHYSINQTELERIMELYPFFIRAGSNFSVDPKNHLGIFASLSKNIDSVTSQTTQELLAIPQTEIKQKPECSAEEILESLDLQRFINENSEEEIFEVLNDYLHLLIEEKRYSILIELEAMVRDLFLMDLNYNLFFRRCLLLLSMAFLLDNNKMRSEAYWNKYLNTCKVFDETDRENLILALQLSFILETDDSLFDTVGRETMESFNGIELELYKLVYDINNESEHSPDLLRKFERASDSYTESIMTNKKKYIDLHREYIETIKISIEMEAGN
ncbi:hypothetical protein [Paenibacillus albus]|uniref:Uncharacterized protein n=1 Tax=Paenibacillus albus TaxID=2495582 RepID=A0A3Q8X589_9BACL|nr:hypothetical protein [Paenibacillus albus]AZN39555.1 hypothetical protein EJC50_07675 [Paenibacillus albus]